MQFFPTGLGLPLSVEAGVGSDWRAPIIGLTNFSSLDFHFELPTQ